MSFNSLLPLHLLTTYFYLFSTGCSKNLPAESNLKLEYAQILWRHGDRSPGFFYPTDPHADYWPQGPGMLTQIGMQQHYNLGTYLKTRYQPSLVSEHYYKSETFVVASHEDRTIESAASNLASFYKPTDWQIFNPELPWQPVPVHPIPESMDHLLLVPGYKCPKWVEDYLIFRESPEFLAMNDSHLELFAYLTEKTGMPVIMDDIGMIDDNLYCVQAHSLELPAWATPEVVEETSVVSDFMFFNAYRTKQQQRMLAGVLLKTIRDAFQNVTDGNAKSLPASKLIIYSAHDATIIGLTTLLDVFNDMKPPYASALLLELYSDENQKFYFKMFFHNETDSEPYALKMKICNFEELCEWDVFYTNSENLTVEDWTAECQTEEPKLVMFNFIDKNNKKYKN